LLDGVQSYPCRELRFGGIPGSDRKHCDDAIRVLGIQAEAVEGEEQFDRNEGGSFVAVDEGMIARNTPAVCRSEISCIWLLAVPGEILRSGKRRFEKPGIANARAPTVFR
jgi:hypothetical protein